MSYTPLWKALDTSKNPLSNDLIVLCALLWSLAFLQDFPEATLSEKKKVCKMLTLKRAYFL